MLNTTNRSNKLVILSGVLIGALPIAVPASPAAAYDPALLCAYPPVTAEPTTVHWSIGREPPALNLCAPRASERRPARGQTSRLRPDDARQALARARALAGEGRVPEAILALRVVERALPALADRVALEEAEYRMAAGPDELACQAYARAAESPHRTVAARGEIGAVRCLLAIGDRRGVRALDELRRGYPELSYGDELTLQLAIAHEGWNERDDAVRLYRQVDLTAPGTSQAALARAALERLRAEGVAVRELTVAQQVERAERLTSGGYYGPARAEIERLRATDLPRPLAQQLARSAARIARVEGRWGDAQALLREAQGLPSLAPEEAAAMQQQASDMARAAADRDGESVRRDVRALLRGRPLSRQPTGRLFSVLQAAARAGERDVANDAARELARRSQVPPGVRFEAGILAAGTADDALVAELFASARSVPRIGVAARYHHARTLERLGRVQEARAEYVQVIAQDDPRLPYYALWARVRMRDMPPSTASSSPPSAALPSAGLPSAGLPSDELPSDQLPSEALPSADVGPTLERATHLAASGVASGAALEPLASCVDGPFTAMPDELAGKTGEPDGREPSGRELVNPRLRTPPSLVLTDPGEALDEESLDLPTAHEPEAPAFRLSQAQMVELLEPVAEEHGEAYPWLVRALRLLEIGELRAADDELHEAFVAWRDARGGGSLRSGLVAVLRGGAPPRMRVAPQTWRERRRISSDARVRLARVAAALGDHGLAIRFHGFGVSGQRPRAYEDLVEAAAARHGVEPELLFAVMRVESVYNPRIISYAGAIGLMQIMPRTGRLIANRLGREDFTVDQLLEPEINVEFAAWYLASLIERFDGRIPLAIASYNGGPHNVRRWMRDHAESMPLDAFLERIPFSQTHRYVRRVLTHYAAYRAQRGQPVASLDVALPAATPDPLAF